MPPELIEPLIKSALIIVVMIIAKIVHGGAARRRHGGGALGFSLDSVIQALPLFPFFATAWTAVRVTFEGAPDWPLWAVWPAVAVGGVLTVLLFNLPPVRDAEARIDAAQKATEPFNRIQL